MSKNDATVNVRMPQGMKDYLQGLADEREISVGEMVRVILAELMDNGPELPAACLVREAPSRIAGPDDDEPRRSGWSESGE